MSKHKIEDVSKTKRNYKDSIFRRLFNDKRELLALYNALTGKSYPAGTEIEIVTLDNAVFKDRKNDVAFVIDRKFINLTEHQSTLSPNMPLRFLEYIAREYRKLYFSEAIYSEMPIKLPTPEFYVLYNGTKDAPLEHTLKLSDTFIGECDTISLELVVKVVNVNYEKGSEVLEKCRTLKEYSLFIHKVRGFMEECKDLDMAIEAAIRECIREGVLAEFLKKNRGDVMSFVELWLTQEECEAIREKDGYNRGRAEEKLAIAKSFKDDGVPLNIIAKNTGLTLEEVDEL